MSTGKQFNRGNKQGGRGGYRQFGQDQKRVIMKPRESSPISLWLQEHAHDLTVELCCEKWKTEDEKLKLIDELIPMIPSNPEFLNVIKDLKPYFPGRVKYGIGHQFNPLHKIIWLPDTTEHYIISELFQLVHEVASYDIFMKNKKDEDAFMSLYIKFSKGQISDQEYLFRYNQMVKFSEKEIDKMITSIFNKIDNINDNMIEIMHVLLLQNYNYVLKKIASLIVTRKIPNKCNAIDKPFVKYIDGMMKILSGVGNNFADFSLVIFSDAEKKFPSFKPFFDQSHEPIPNMTHLVQLLWTYVWKFVAQDKGDNTGFNYESTGIIIGALAETNRLVDQYKDFVLQCLSTDSEDDFANIGEEIRLRMAIRAVVQATQTAKDIKNLPKDIVNAFKSYKYPTTYYQVIVDELLGNNYQVHHVQEKEILTSINYFEGLDKDTIDETVEYAVELFNKQLTKFPCSKSVIINNFMVSLFENMMPKYNPAHIRQICKGFEQIKNEIIREKKSIEETIIPDLKPDIPNCGKIWKDLKDIIA